LQRLSPKARALLPLLAGVAIALVFIGLNYKAYDGFFQDDELDNIKWAPSRPVSTFVRGFLEPRFQVDNFRPAGHLYFALMGGKFGLDFPPYVTPIFVFHLLNALLLYLLMRTLDVKRWSAIAAVAFFTLSATAFDTYWKPMYVFDLLCTTFSLTSILLYAYRRWVLSFIAFWLAYKSKELAVMLPAVLVVYEYWFGERKFKVLIPFLLASLNFGIQGVLLNPNKDNDYTLRFTFDALRHTLPFYAKRFLLFPLSGVLLFGLAFVRDRRIGFGLAAISLLMVPLLFLPGRLFEAYAYLPLAFASIAIAAAASRFSPVWLWIALAIWMPFNLRQLRHERRATLEADDQAFAFVDTVEKWVRRNPDVSTFVYDGMPPGFHAWGVTGAWNIVHGQIELQALFAGWPETDKILPTQTVAYGVWDARRKLLAISVRPPSRGNASVR
jgi:hypothetical protein